MTPEAIVRDYLGLLERRDLDGLAGVVAEDVVAHRSTGEVAVEGLDAWLGEQAASPFVDERVTVEDLLTDGTKVVVRYRLECTLGHEFLGVPGDGRRLTAHGIKIYRVRDGKIAEIWGVDDLYGLLVQLEVVPPLERLAESA